jgi:hypothetical protein
MSNRGQLPHPSLVTNDGHIRMVGMSPAPYVYARLPLFKLLYYFIEGHAVA